MLIKSHTRENDAEIYIVFCFCNYYFLGEHLQASTIMTQSMDIRLPKKTYCKDVSEVKEEDGMSKET